LKKESGAYKITMLHVCLSLCFPSITFDQNGRFYEIQQRGNAIEGDLHAIHFNPVAETIKKWRVFKLLRWMKNLYQSTWDYGILHSDMSQRMNNYEGHFVRYQKYQAGGRLVVKCVYFVLLWR
jgi:hypothetical protein